MTSPDVAEVFGQKRNACWRITQKPEEAELFLKEVEALAAENGQRPLSAPLIRHLAKRGFKIGESAVRRHYSKSCRCWDE